MPIDIRQLQAFVRVVTDGSYSKAAYSLNLTQSSVSSRIAALERSVGRKLFVRRRNGMELTRSGQRLLPFAERILATTDEAVHSLKMFGRIDEARETLRIGSNTAAACDIAPGLVTAFRERSRADIFVHLQVHPTRELIPLLMDGTVELAFINPALSHHLTEVVLEHQCDSVLVASPRHRLAGCTVHALDLVDEEFIAYSVEPVDYELRGLANYLDQPLRIAASTNSAAGVRSFVLQNAALGYLPLDAARVDLDTGVLERIDIRDYQPPPWRLSLVRWSHRELTSAAREFASFASAALRRVEAR